MLGDIISKALYTYTTTVKEMVWWALEGFSQQHVGCFHTCFVWGTHFKTRPPPETCVSLNVNAEIAPTTQSPDTMMMQSANHQNCPIRVHSVGKMNRFNFWPLIAFIHDSDCCVSDLLCEALHFNSLCRIAVGTECHIKTMGWIKIKAKKQNLSLQCLFATPVTYKCAH